MKKTFLAALSALSALLSLPAVAQELSIGLSTPVTTMDPHFHNLTPNNSIAKHIFETLVHQDDQQALRPGLAESWRAVDSTTWEIKLRKNVRWHDGSPFTAEDVLATLKRIPNVPNSPASFAIYTRPITDARAADAHTVIMKTREPHPLLPNDLATIHIIPKKVEAMSTQDFNSGKAVIGTGPYRFGEYVSGDRVVLTVNDKYWGAKPAHAKVRFRMITNSAARVAALLAGDVQMIEAVPTADIEKLKKDARVSLASTVSNRIIYLHMDSGRERNSPFVTDTAGKPMEANPLRDPRVRKALSKMIDRNAIASRIMEGEARPAGQFLPETFHGTSKKLSPDKYDPEGAKKLLAEAGYPNGFGLTLHTPNNRYINDEKISQAVAQFLTRGGIPTKVEAMPSAVFFSRGSKLEFSFMLVGWGAGTGENSSPLRSLVATFDTKLGNGGANRGRFSDAGVDAMINTALTTIDDTKRGIMLAAATDKAIGEMMGVIPVHFEISTWGVKKGLSYKARVDQYTLAHEVMSARK
ncbi:MAG: ABC transporter substrate-binding protein [Candidatus Parcubacteria bacterium]|nr:ABC transporter substrate-binding protein [Burkholderiales bacterium]